MSRDLAERAIAAMHEDANGLVWTTKAELFALLAESTPAAPDEEGLDALRNYNDCDCVPGHRCDCWDFRAANGIRQFEVEAVTPGPQYQPRTISDRAAFRAWLAKALGATITKRRPSWASDTVQGLVAAGEYDAAAEAIDRLLAESTPAAPDERLGAFMAFMGGVLTNFDPGARRDLLDIAEQHARALSTPAAPDEEGLDAAWAAAEASLPDGWAIEGLVTDTGPTAGPAEDYAASAGLRGEWVPMVEGRGKTPAAALRDLARALASQDKPKERA